MTIVLTIIHVIVCFFLVVVVLLQSGKAADLAGAFGGMGSQTAFGPRGSATVLSRATTVAAAVFMVTSLTLAILATRNATASGSVLERQKAPAAKTAPGATSGADRQAVRQHDAGRWHNHDGAVAVARGTAGRKAAGREAAAAVAAEEITGLRPRGGGGIGRRTSLRC